MHPVKSTRQPIASAVRKDTPSAPQVFTDLRILLVDGTHGYDSASGGKKTCARSRQVRGVVVGVEYVYYHPRPQYGHYFVDLHSPEF